MPICEWETCLRITEHVLVIGGILFALVLYPQSQFESSYERLNDHFMRFLEMQVEYPMLGTNTSDRELKDLTPEQLARQAIIFDYLSSLLERAFYFLNDGINKWLFWRHREWDTWEEWIEIYSQNQNYVQFWRTHHAQACYGEEFMNFIRGKFNLTGHEPGAAASSDATG